jgi:hypothetical protein
MEMFLMALALSLLGVAVSTMAFAAATRGEPTGPADAARPRTVAALGAGQTFFIEPDPVQDRQVPVAALLLQIERHVRLEHAAAEAFQQAPTPELLHVRTASPLVH